MEIIKKSVESKDRMYCSSTGEILFSPDMPEVNDDTKAFIAYWHNEVLDQPEIKDPELAAAREEFFEKKWFELDEEMSPGEIVTKFLKEYQNEQWVVYECVFPGMACGPFTTTVYIVVKAGTVIEKDPEY